MVDSQNVTVVGCSVHPILDGVVLYSLWVTDNDTLSTSMILVEGSRFKELTNTKANYKSEQTFKCSYCTNHRCTLREKADLHTCLNKIFAPHRRYERVGVSLKGFANFGAKKVADIKINNIGIGGLQCEIIDEDFDVTPGDLVRISICSCGFLENCNCKRCFNLKELSGEVIEGRVVWLLGKNCGIQVESPKSVANISNIMGLLGIV